MHCFFFFFRANPAFNPYYYGYAPYPAYPQQYPYPYQYVQNDGTQPPTPAQGGGWGEYFQSFFNYVPNFPAFTSESQSTSEAESQGGSAESSAESACKKLNLEMFNQIYSIRLFYV